MFNRVFFLFSAAIFFCAILISCLRSETIDSPSSKEIPKWQPTMELAGLINFDKDFAGFKKSYGPNFYNTDTIYDYIDGGADLYLGAGCKELLNFEIENLKDAKLKLSIDLYNMEGQDNSKKIYEKVKSGKQDKLKDGTVVSVSPNMIEFAKGKYYVKMVSFAPVEKKILTELAGAVAKKIR
jgi:hypothetical protein